MKGLDFEGIRSQTDQEIAKVVREKEAQLEIMASLEKEPVYQRHVATQKEIWRLKILEDSISPRTKYLAQIDSFVEGHMAHDLFEIMYKRSVHSDYRRASLKQYRVIPGGNIAPICGPLIDLFSLMEDCGEHEEITIFSPLDERVVEEIRLDPFDRIRANHEILDNERARRVQKYFTVFTENDDGKAWANIKVNIGQEEETFSVEWNLATKLMKKL